MQTMMLNMQEWVIFLLIALVLLCLVGLTCWAAFKMIGAVLNWVFNKREEYLKQQCRSNVRLMPTAVRSGRYTSTVPTVVNIPKDGQDV